jgi:hypothetical protein
VVVATADNTASESLRSAHLRALEDSHSARTQAVLLLAVHSEQLPSVALAYYAACSQRACDEDVG